MGFAVSTFFSEGGRRINTCVSMYEELVGGGLYIVGVSKVVFEQMFE
jgi:hypothetical protein